MNKLIIFSVYIVLFFSFGVASKNLSEIRYTAPPMIYIDNDRGEYHFYNSFIVINYNRKSIDYGDASTPFEVSSEDDEWFSFRSGILNFAFSKSWTQFPQHWSYDGFEYNHEGLIILELLGKSVTANTIIVRRENSNYLTVVLFESNIGIVGFYKFNHEDETVEMFLLQGLIGIRP